MNERYDLARDMNNDAMGDDCDYAAPPPANDELRVLADEINQCLQIIVSNAGNWPIMSDKLKGSHSFRRERKEALKCQKNIENAVERAKKATWAAIRREAELQKAF